MEGQLVFFYILILTTTLTLYRRVYHNLRYYQPENEQTSELGRVYGEEKGPWSEAPTINNNETYSLLRQETESDPLTVSSYIRKSDSL